MIGRLVGLAAFGACAALGIAFQDAHVRLDQVGYPSDQRLLAHRDSTYTSMSYVASEAGNYLQLRFFDRVEGGVCLRPTWQEMIDAGFTHLKPAGALPAPAPADRGWPADVPLPSPGALNNSAYISLFPVGVLANERVMTAAGGDLAQAKPEILIVGLGSGVGIANLAANVPQARITVVDIDAEVIAMVRAHYPLLQWLESTGRLTLVARDARQFIRYSARQDPEKGAGGFDLILLDAYTAGSTIPPHLMTREFFGHCAAALREGGLLMANVIGGYGERKDGKATGDMYRTLGGAIRSMRACGLAQLRNIPVIHGSAGDFSGQLGSSRNNIVIAARHPLSPEQAPAIWQRLAAYQPFRGLPEGTWRSSTYALIANNKYSSVKVPAAAIDAIDGSFRARFTAQPSAADRPMHETTWSSDDSQVIAAAQKAAAQLPGGRPTGWDAKADRIVRHDTDWTRFPREVWRVSIQAGRDQIHDGEMLTGPVDPPGGERPYVRDTVIVDPPLYTDQRPNADIWNR